MSLLRFLGLGERPRQGPEATGETETVRRIAARLERLAPERARVLAAFAYVLARVAHTDMRIDEAESAEMERRVAALADLTPEEAALAVEIAKSHARLLGGTENYVVTREFRALSTPEQRSELVSCLFAVAAADGSISAAESNQITAIADELGLERDELARLRGEWRHKLGVLQGMKRG